MTRQAHESPQCRLAHASKYWPQELTDRDVEYHSWTFMECACVE